MSEKPKIEALNPTTGEVVYTFTSMTAVSEAAYKRAVVQDCIDGRQYEYAGMLWRRSGEPVPQPPAYVPRRPKMAFAILDQFVAECLHDVPGALIPFSEFYDRFIDWLPAEAKGAWSRIRVTRTMPRKFASGTGNQNKTYITNAAWAPGPAKGPRLQIVHGRIKRPA
jgi:hypothetical protein